MQTLELSFEAINCTKFEASMRMDVKTFNKLTEIFSPKMLSGNVDESSYKSGQTFFDSKGTKEIDNQLDTVENCTIS